MKSFMKYALIGLPVILVFLAVVVLAMYVPAASVILFWVVALILTLLACFAIGYGVHSLYESIKGKSK